MQDLEFYDLQQTNPDLNSLFVWLNERYFDGVLAAVEVKWSQKMTLCAGVCSFENHTGFCSIRLSEPILKYRPFSDMVNTLLHEMIHAYLFVTKGNTDRTGHGPRFLSHMVRINKLCGSNISVFHSFVDEVDVHRSHWWQCNGPCSKISPRFGLVKRAMNRPPGKSDFWFSRHQRSCGGSFIKIKEPEKTARNNVANRKRKAKQINNRDIRKMLNKK